jgi:hypothetical protein
LRRLELFQGLVKDGGMVNQGKIDVEDDWLSIG